MLRRTLFLIVSHDRLVLMAWPETTEIASLPAPAGADSLVVSASQNVVVIGLSVAVDLPEGWLPNDRDVR